MDPPLQLLTRDAAPIISRVASQLTALQGIGYSGMASTTSFNYSQEGDRHRMECCTCVDTLYVVVTAQVPLQYFAGFFDRQTPVQKHLC